MSVGHVCLVATDLSGLEGMLRPGPRQPMEERAVAADDHLGPASRTGRAQHECGPAVILVWIGRRPRGTDLCAERVEIQANLAQGGIKGRCLAVHHSLQASMGKNLP